MQNNFFKSSLGNIHLKPLSRSEIVSQILYGEKFEILSKNKNWLKIKANFDNYVGFIKINEFNKKFYPTRKIYKLKTKVFKKIKGKYIPTKELLFFGSGISIKNQNKKFIEFEKNKWVKKRDTKNIKHKEKNFSKVIKLFLNTKYLWGGKTAEGIDCSALIQIFFYYNRIFFPRDTKDQVKYCKRKLTKTLLKGDIIFWKGHVGICLNKSKFIHAYGPKKKVVIMPTKFTIKHISKTANLRIKKISNIQKY